MRFLAFLAGFGLLSAADAWSMPREYPIRPSSDGHHFVDSAGKPFFWQADTVWTLFHRLTLEEAGELLDDRAAKGFNMIQAVGLIMFGDQDPNRAGDLPLINRDPARPNEAYWKHVDKVVELAWKKGIRIAMVPCWGYYVHVDTNEPGLVTAKNARAFGKWIGKRYAGLPKFLVGDTNSYWTNKTAVRTNYATGGVQPTYQFTDYAPVYDEMAEGIVEGEGRKAQISTHCTNQWFHGTPIAVSSAFFGDRKWLTFDASQSGHASYPPNPPIEWWNCKRGYEPVEIMYRRKQARPALDMEAHYENRFDNGKPINTYWNASDIRVGSYQAAFAGAAGVTYGSDNVMQTYDPALFTPSNSGPAVAWRKELQLPGAGQVQFVKKVILDRAASPLDRIPDQSVIVGDAGRDDKRLAGARDRSGTYLLVYTPTGAPFTVDAGKLKKVGRGQKVKANWFNPISGKYSEFSWAGTSGKTLVTPPAASGHVDWVLVLEVV